MQHVAKSVVAAMTGGIFLAVSGMTMGADHVDSPITKNDPTADITDVYAFVNPNNPDEYILVANVFPFANDGTRFSDVVEYEFHLENSAGVENSIVCTFSRPDPASLDQQVTCNFFGDTTVEGPIGEVLVNGGFQVFAGLRDDPFFFDFLDFEQPPLDNGQTLFEPPAEDFFAGLNVMSIVLGIPIQATSQNPTGDPTFTQKVWFSTDRTGNAGIQPGYTALWYDPDQGGMGFQFEVLPNEATGGDDDTGDASDLLAVWYFFHNGNPVWLHGRGDIDGKTATVPMTYTLGGGNLDSFNEDNVVRTQVGTLTVTGMDCNNAMIEFDSTDNQFPDVSFPITRLSNVKGLDCQFFVGGHIDRMGRPAVTTALIPKPVKDAYNQEHDPSQWQPQFQDEIRATLVDYDDLDGNVGNQLLDYDTLSAVLADDRLIIATDVPNCGPYLAVELTPAGQTPEACGGRTLTVDVIDVTLTAFVGSPTSDGVDSNDVPFLAAFPFLAPPQ